MSPPRALLLVFCAGLAIAAAMQTGHVTESVDIRTYVEMMRGVSLHGLPWLDNGPVERFPALQVPWNVFVNGRYWGVYAPAYPYFGAPFIGLGLRAVSIATFALLVPIALATFALARRLYDGDEWSALAAAVLSVIATPLLGKSLDLSAFPLATLFVVLAAYAAVREWHVAIGLFSALAIASHIVTTPICLGIMAGAAFVNRSPRSALAALGLGLGLLPVAALNHVRFGSWNPLSYGPTPWNAVGGVAGMSIGGHLGWAVPVMIVVVPAGIGVFAARGRRLVRAGIVVAALVALSAWPLARERALAYLTTARAFLLDMSLLDELVPPHTRVAGVFGSVMGPWVVKSTLQCTPVLALAALVRPRGRMLVVLAPICALYIYLTLRANVTLPPALGYPWVYLRYTVPVLPLFVVAAVGVAREVRPHPLVAIGSGAALAAFLLLSSTRDDAEHALSRHVVLIVLPLVLAAAAVIGVVLVRRRGWNARIAGVAVALACGASIAMGIGHDLATHRQGKAYCTWRLDEVAQLLPDRFALIGHLESMDVLLALRASRDVQYAQFEQGDVVPVVAWWLAEDRPVFYVASEDHPASPSPDFDLVLVSETHRVYRIVRHEL